MVGPTGFWGDFPFFPLSIYLPAVEDEKMLFIRLLLATVKRFKQNLRIYQLTTIKK